MLIKDQFSVKVVGSPSGEVVQQNPNKPEYGSITFEQHCYTMRNNFLNCRRKVSFLAGTMQELSNYTTAMNLKAGGNVSGKLYTVEQFTPFYEGQQPKLNPQTGRACLIDGAMVWSKTFYDETGTRNDIYLNGEVSEGGIISESKTPLAVALRANGISLS